MDPNDELAALQAEMARRSGAPGSSAPVTPAGPDSAIPGAGETLQWPLKQADGSDYVVPGGTNMPAGSAPTSAPTQSSPPLSVSANSELQALQAEMARRQAAPAASGAGPSGYAADSTGVTPPTPSMVQTLLNYAKKEGPPIAGGYTGGALGAGAGPLVLHQLHDVVLPLLSDALRREDDELATDA